MSTSPKPIIRMAALFERFLQEQNGSLSFIRMLDRYTLVAQGDEPPEQIPDTLLPEISFVLSIFAGDVRGAHVFHFQVRSPDGKITQLPAQYFVDFQKEDDGNNFIVQMRLRSRQVGTYWVEVNFDEEALTRVPLQIVYESQKLSQPQDEGEVRDRGQPQ